MGFTRHSEDARVVFQGKQIKRTWHDNQWYFLVVDVISVLTDSPTPGQYWGKVRDRASKQPESPLGPGTTEIAVTGWQASATDFRKHRKSHHTDRNRPHTTHAPDRTQLRDSNPRRRQAGTKNSSGTRKPVLFAAQESPDDMSDSD